MRSDPNSERWASDLSFVSGPQTPDTDTHHSIFKHRFAGFLIYGDRYFVYGHVYPFQSPNSACRLNRMLERRHNDYSTFSNRVILRSIAILMYRRTAAEVTMHRASLDPISYMFSIWTSSCFILSFSCGYYAVSSISGATRSAYDMYLIRTYADLTFYFRLRHTICFSYCVYFFCFTFFHPEVIFHSRVIGACPVITDCILAMSKCENNNNIYHIGLQRHQLIATRNFLRDGVLT